MDRQAYARDAGRVGHRELIAGLDRDPPVHLDLAARVHQECAVSDVINRHTVQRPNGLDDGLGVRGV